MRAHLARVKQGLAAFEASEGRFEEAARLLGQAKRELEDLGNPDDSFGSVMNAETVERVRAAIGDEAYEAAYAAGRESSV